MKNPEITKNYLVIESYRRTHEDAIVMRRGDRLTIGPDFTDDPEWPNWIWCRNAAGKAGWVPRSLVAVNGPQGTALENFDARELSVHKGESLTVSRVLNGWAWAHRPNGEAGWVPLRQLEPQTPSSSRNQENRK